MGNLLAHPVLLCIASCSTATHMSGVPVTGSIAVVAAGLAMCLQVCASGCLQLMNSQAIPAQPQTDYLTHHSCSWSGHL